MWGKNSNFLSSFFFSGPGDGFFSSAFQSTLKGNVLYKNTVPAGLFISIVLLFGLFFQTDATFVFINFVSFICLDLAFGSIVTIKNHRAGGALLHSHPHLYPKEHGPEQQQVRCFSLVLRAERVQPCCFFIQKQ